MIFLERAAEKDMKKIYDIQKKAFKKLYNQYQDNDSPYNEPLSSLTEKYTRPNNYFFIIKEAATILGYLRIVTNEEVDKASLSQIAILPGFDDNGYGTKAMILIEEIFSTVNEWYLGTIYQEQKLVHFYSKLGYQQVGELQNIKKNMDIIFFKKDSDALLSNHRSVFLRLVNDKDIEKIHQWWTDGRIMAPVGFPNGLSITKKQVNHIVKKYQDNKNSDFLIILNENQIEIGEFAYSKSSNDSYTFDIKIGEYDYQRKGYGKQALLKGIELIQSQKNAKRIEISVAPENLRALNLYKSIGFKLVRQVENNWIDQLGISRSTNILELIIG